LVTHSDKIVSFVCLLETLHFSTQAPESAEFCIEDCMNDTITTDCTQTFGFGERS